MNNFEQELTNALAKGTLYDFIANNYYQMSNYELKELLLSVLGVALDRCCGDEDEEALHNLIKDECVFRDLIEDKE